MTISPPRPLRPRVDLSSGDAHEQIVIRQDARTGMRLIVAVHSTVLGPALGGLRMKSYAGGLREALEDVMGLARTMTLKASAAGLELGGGKAVMIDDGDDSQRFDRLEAAARVIEGLGGAYITAEDIGTTTADMDHMASFTRYCVGRSETNGGGGDPSPVTAETVLAAMRRGLAAQTGSDDLAGRRVGVIGLGKVGGVLAARLVAEGAHVVGCDLDYERCELFAAEHGNEISASAEAILSTQLDVLAPCAGGGLIDDELARALDVRVVAGAANNPLTDRSVAGTLMERGILYVPDFLANCGGLIHVAGEWFGDREAERARIEHAMDRLDEAIAGAAAEGGTALEVAERQALERVDAARRSPAMR
jgi:glutamate dehydrogenase/leucine dehydrogenase